MNSEKIFNKPHLMFSHLGHYGWVPIPLSLIVIIGLWVANLQTVYESRSVMVALNLLFTWLASLCISILTARVFLKSGQPGLLMFGCGSLLWGLTSLAAAMIVGSQWYWPARGTGLATIPLAWFTPRTNTDWPVARYC